MPTGQRTGSWLHRERLEIASKVSVRPQHAADLFLQPSTLGQVHLLALPFLLTSFREPLVPAVLPLQPPVNEMW